VFSNQVCFTRLATKHGTFLMVQVHQGSALFLYKLILYPNQPYFVGNYR
jgi:hypothetical protein